jgi:hypothetical protein
MTYQIKVTLNGSKPPIWRRLLVPESISLGDLHVVLQVSFGWTDSHLHQFIAKGKFYGQPDPEFGVNAINESRVSLGEVLAAAKDAMVYEYDFGDCWEHKIVLEKILANSEESSKPSCIAGSRACPPEDCGGVWGYANLMETIADPSHPDHEEMIEWLGDDFDPEYFDLAEINEDLNDIKFRSLSKLSAPKARKPKAT